ncbi:DUF4292 domain-containing protein [Sporocytophaga myxococcoides]|uniref:DUF4292 domain-containing protein n=1 Tax=Sporocytophaga myxococcoides TaxID=153721 RepID=UPI000420EDB3|nr:DUF4292 domain-containing protein [Sporocytophaga myxococcoides]
MNNIKSLFFLFSLTLIFSSCKKNLTPTTATQEEIINLTVQEIDYNYFSAKAKVDFKDNEQDLHFTVNIRMKKDSIVWLSISPALGIEAARCLILKDSVYMIDRINNKYSSYDLSFLSHKFNVPMDLPTIQALLVGNMPFKRDHHDKIIKNAETSTCTVEQHKTNLIATNFISLVSMVLKKLELTEKVNHNHLIINYDNFAPINNYNFPNKISVNLNYKQGGTVLQTTIDADYTKVEFPEKELGFPFNVPRRFENR